MKAVDEPDTNRFPEADSASNALASWYAPGPSDELGDRLLMFDNSSAPSLELLRFRPELSGNPDFEAALRERVDRLNEFTHPSFATVRAVEHLGPNDGLSLLSNYTPGRRLSEVLQDARGPAFATALIQLLAPALASLRQHGGGTGHGALASNRIIITPEGRLVIVEHALGPALEGLQLDPDRLRSEFGIAVPPTRAPYPRLDIRADYFQLGIIALSLLIGRQVRPDVSLDQIGRLLNQAATTAERESPVLFRRLRVWLERALQLDGEIFRSPSDAQDALNSVADPVAAPRTLRSSAPRAIPARTETSQAPPSLEAPPVPAYEVRQPDIVTVAAHEPQAVLESVATPPAPEPVQQIETIAPPVQYEAAPVVPPEDAPIEIPETPPQSRLPVVDWKTHAMSVARQAAVRLNESFSALRVSTQRAAASLPQAPAVRWPSLAQALAAALAVCVVGEGFAIAMLLNRRAIAVVPAVLVETGIPGADVLVDGRAAGTTPLQLNIGTDVSSVRVVDARPPVPTAGIVMPEAPPAPAAKPEGRRPDVAATPPQRSGGIRLVTPFEVEVFEGNKRLGSSSTGIVSAAAGRRELELVNSRFGYRVRRTVEVRAGRVTPVEVSPPNGLLSINASPWAEVWIDGKPAGETPLANLSVPLGEHEIVFRHPEMGEQRRTALVRVDGVTRVSVNFQR